MPPGPARSAPLLRANHGSPWRRQAWALAWGIITPREEYLSSGEYKRQRRAPNTRGVGTTGVGQLALPNQTTEMIRSVAADRGRLGERQRLGTMRLQRLL